MPRLRADRAVETLSCRTVHFGLSRSRLLWYALVLLFTLALIVPGDLWAWNANFRMCFPHVINTPDTYHQPPAIDGVVVGDNGWTSAWRYSFNNGSFVHDAVVQAIRDSQFLYLSFEVNHDLTYDENDVLIIATDPGSAADRRLIEIFPQAGGGLSTTIWQGQDDPFTPWVGGTMPAGTEILATNTGTGSDLTWYVEVKLPRADFGIPADDAVNKDFGLYFNIIPVNGPTEGPSGGGFDLGPIFGFVTEYPWPADAANLVDLYVYDLDTPVFPDPTIWGTATVDAGTCNGVYITPSDIYTDNTPVSRISLTAPNVFHATVHNISTDSSGTFIPATGINATFKIANFGLSDMWSEVQETAPSSNPTATMDIGANSSADFTMSWTLTSDETATYAAHPHQCILVELDSAATATPWATVFTNKSAWTNMNFAYSSVVESSPRIDIRGMRPKHGKKESILDLWITKRIDRLGRRDILNADEPARVAKSNRKAGRPRSGSWADLATIGNFPAEKNDSWKEYHKKLKNPFAQVSQLTYLVHGCAETGRTVRIKGKDYAFCRRIGSYGYVLRHAGLSKAEWKFDLGAPGVEPVKGMEGRYRVPHVKPLTMAHRFEASDAKERLTWFKEHYIASIAVCFGVIGLLAYLRRKGKGAR